MKSVSKYLLLSLLLIHINCKDTPATARFELKAMASPAGPDSSFPYLFAGADTMWMSWVETNDSLATLNYAAFKEGEWQESQEINRGSDWFVNWADFPAITENKGNLLSHVLQKSSGGTYSYDVKLSHKAGEDPWKNNLPLHTDSTFTEHGFVSSVPYNQGFFISWLDGRNTVEQPDGSRGPMSLRAAELSSNGEVISSTMTDARVCDCCQTTAAITSNGPVVIYRDRSEEEVRDISIVRQVNGAWTEPKQVHQDNWKINGCPVNGPKVAVRGNTLAVAWFTGKEGATAVKLAFSEDSGANFDAPILLAGAESIGRVDIVLLDEDNAIASWMGSTGDNAAIYAMRVGKDDSKGPVRVIAQLDASRRTGFPQMELLGDTIYFAWTDAGENQSVIHCAYAEADTF